jgi:hypothetical protein
MTTTALTPAPDSYRGGNGRFLPGNPGGPGNPLARQIGRLRSALHEALTEEEMVRVVRAMLKKAQAGDVAAARLCLEYAIGKPMQGSVAAALDAECAQQLSEDAVNALTVEERVTLLGLMEKANQHGQPGERNGS